MAHTVSLPAHLEVFRFVIQDDGKLDNKLEHLLRVEVDEVKQRLKARLCEVEVRHQQDRVLANDDVQFGLSETEKLLCLLEIRHYGTIVPCQYSGVPSQAVQSKLLAKALFQLLDSVGHHRDVRIHDVQRPDSRQQCSWHQET